MCAQIKATSSTDKTAFNPRHKTN